MRSHPMIKELHINDLFWTFQGEGKYAGRRALFVRMPYCNLACEWCDTTFNSFKKVTEQEFIDFASRSPARHRFAVVTGGEPTLHKHTSRIVDLLHGLGFYVAAESNGTNAPNANFDFLTISPKRQSVDKFKIPYYVDQTAFETASEFKYVVDRFFDFSILERHKIGNTLNYPRLSLSPEFGEFKENMNKIYDYIKENPNWLISLQTHKFLGIA